MIEYLLPTFTGERNAGFCYLGIPAHRALDRKLHANNATHPKAWGYENVYGYHAVHVLPWRKAGRALASSNLLTKGSKLIPGKEEEFVRLLRTTNNPNAKTLMENLLPAGLYAQMLNAGAKFANDEWQRPVWQDEAWFAQGANHPLHFLHISTEDPSMVAYADSAAKLTADRYTRIRPGKYLARFYSDVLSEEQIKYWAEQHVSAGATPELHFIDNDDPDGWGRVYAEGPHSCMKNESSVRVYAHPDNDLRLAYTKSPDGNYITARSIVRTDEGNKGYIRVYPNANSTEDIKVRNKMFAALEAAGFTEQTSLRGAKLKRIEHDEGFACPYLDGDCTQVDDMGDYLLVTPSGEYDGQVQDGYIGHSHSCDECGDRCGEDDTTYIECEEIDVCEHCLSSHFVLAYARRNQEWVRTDDAVYCSSDDEWYHTDYLGHHDIMFCSHTDKYWHVDDMTETHDGTWYHEDECVQLDNEFYASDDYALEADTVEDHEGRIVLYADCIKDREGDFWHWDDLHNAAQTELELKEVEA